MRILHAAVSMNPSPGVVRQMEWENRAAHSLGLIWHVSLHTPRRIRSSVVVSHSFSGAYGSLQRYLALRRGFYKWLREVAAHYDIILLRHSVHDPMQVQFALSFGRKLVTIHHTKEEQEIARSLRGGRALALVEKVCGRVTLRKVAGIVGVTGEILDYEMERANRQDVFTWVYPNGIWISDGWDPRDERQGKVPEIVFVAGSFHIWHGLDRLLESARKCQLPCKIHIVGRLSKEQVHQCRADSRFVVHGLLDEHALGALLAKAWCGIASLALERKSMEEACPLKVREYLMHGVPVYGTHRDAAIPESFPYYKKRKSVSLEEIIAFAEEMRSVPKRTIANEARPFIDKRDIVRRFHAALEEAFS